MDDFTLWRRNGELTDPWRPYTVYLYPNSASGRTAMEDTGRYGTYDLCEQLLPGTSIDFYDIYIHDNNMGLPDDSMSTFKSEFEDYCSGDNPYNSDYTQYIGTHLGIGDNFQAGATYSEVAFDSFSLCVFGLENANSDYMKMGFAHEPLHTCIKSTLSCIEQETNGGSEHKLGEIYSDGRATVMTDSYTEYLGEGECDKAYDHQKNTTELTGCSLRAVDCTADNSY